MFNLATNSSRNAERKRWDRLREVNNAIDWVYAPVTRIWTLFLCGVFARILTKDAVVWVSFLNIESDCAFYTFTGVFKKVRNTALFAFD